MRRALGVITGSGWLVAVLLATGVALPILAEEQPDAQKRAMVSLGLNSEALAQNHPDRAVWLETELHGRVLVLFEPEQTAAPKGAILALADEGQSANTGLAGAFRSPLAEAGWAVMTMGLPELPLALEAARRSRAERPRPAGNDSNDDNQEPSEGAGEPASDEPAADAIMIDVMDSDDLTQLAENYHGGVQAYLAAAVAELTARGYERVVLIGIGRGAMQVARQVADGKVNQPALVWVAPVLEPGDDELLAQWLEASRTLAMLELNSSQTAKPGLEARMSLLKRTGSTGYRQQSVAMSDRPRARNARQLANRITAWLSND